MSTFIKVLHYVEKSFDNKPSFIIEMSDGEYISNGCLFAKNTKEIKAYLMSEYVCKEELNELLNAPPIEMKDLVNGNYMFDGCYALTEWTEALPQLENGDCMFYHARLTKWNVELPELVNGDSMFYKSTFINWTTELPKLKEGDCLFYCSPFNQ
jgi:hypothetical protein